MKTIFKHFLTFGFYLLMTTFLSSSICEGEAALDCTITGAKYVKKAQDVVDIISSGGQIDCSEIKELFDELYTLLRDGKNCTAIQTAVQAAGFDSVEELISDYELLLADKGC